MITVLHSSRNLVKHFAKKNLMEVFYYGLQKINKNKMSNQEVYTGLPHKYYSHGPIHWYRSPSIIQSKLKYCFIPYRKTT